MSSHEYIVLAQYFLLVISPSIFLGRLVAWYIWQEHIIQTDRIIPNYRIYLLGILLVVAAKLAMIFEGRFVEILIHPSIYIFVITFFIPIIVTFFIITNKSSLVVNESNTINLSPILLNVIIIFISLPILFLIYFFIGAFRFESWDLIGAVIFSPFLLLFTGLDITEVCYQTFKFLRKSIKVQNKIIIYEKEFVTRYDSSYSNSSLSENGRFKCLTDILIDRHGWKTIFFDEEKVFQITWELENGIYEGPFFKVHKNTLLTFSEKNWENERLPETRLDEVLKNGRKIKFNVNKLLKRDTTFKFFFLDNIYKEFFYENMDKKFTVELASFNSPGFRSSQDPIYQKLANSRNFMIKDENGTLYVLSFDILQMRDFVYLEV